MMYTYGHFKFLGTLICDFNELKIHNDMFEFNR